MENLGDYPSLVGFSLQLLQLSLQFSERMDIDESRYCEGQMENITKDHLLKDYELYYGLREKRNYDLV